jgi:outer membrane cobalamin receptor
LITRGDIERSGATDGWDALRRAGTFMSMKEGRGASLGASQRGRSSILLRDEMLLVVDDVVQNDLTALRQIPAQSIDWMKILSGPDATFLYGTPGSNGVIIVKTGVAHDL